MAVGESGTTVQARLPIPHSKLKSRFAAEDKRQCAIVKFFGRTMRNSPSRQDGPTEVPDGSEKTEFIDRAANAILED